ncbi:MAG: ABC transporter substrate-binding protein, partial [Planctomycetota bacterium]
MRIVSLLPSATEMICGLGLIESLVGVTHECKYPTEVTRVPCVTHSPLSNVLSSREIDGAVRAELSGEGTLYHINNAAMKAASPDVIITQTVCNVCAVSMKQVQNLAHELPGRPEVINLEPSTLEDVFHCIRTLGSRFQCEAQAEHFLNRLKSRVRSVRVRSETIERRPKVVLLEWIDPPFSSGHWNPELVEMAGGC